VAGGDHRLRGFPALGETTPDELDVEAAAYDRGQPFQTEPGDDDARR